jgi:nicotinate-nucleotide pyrophosphorylase (carboxylating)
MQPSDHFLVNLQQAVAAALAEDVGGGDISAVLIPEGAMATAVVITREPAVICGQAWVDEVFRQVDARIAVDWYSSDGEAVVADQALFAVRGPARGILTAERSALNFLQLLSGTATTSASYAELVRDYSVELLDTRKTIPGLRLAQKYAVTCGGCRNHRVGLYDAFLIKENHITACGSIGAAIAQARQQQPDKAVEVEVENLQQLDEALAAGADIVMLDNFAPALMVEAVARTRGRAKLEASGGVSRDTLGAIAATGVDYISIGALTKDVKSIDLSMRLQLAPT